MTTDIFQTANVLEHFAPQLTFRPVAVLDEFADSTHLVLGKVNALRNRIYARLPQHAEARTPANAIDARERNFNALAIGERDACDAYCHVLEE